MLCHMLQAMKTVCSVGTVSIYYPINFTANGYFLFFFFTGSFLVLLLRSWELQLVLYGAIFIVSSKVLVIPNLASMRTLNQLRKNRSTAKLRGKRYLSLTNI